MTQSDSVYTVPREDPIEIAKGPDQEVMSRCVCLMRLSALLVLCAAVSGLVSCSDTTCPYAECEKDTIGFCTSFETDADTLGWRQYGHIDLVDDAPRQGGFRCLLVSGGCDHPHARHTLGHAAEDGHYTIRCWGKLLQGSGGVALRVIGRHRDEEMILGIDDPTWDAYSSRERLLARAGDSLEIHLSSGGFAPGAMHVDLIEVIRINP